MVEGVSVDAIAYADDLSLFARSPEELKIKLQHTVSAAQLVGLSLNHAKSLVINIVSSKALHKTAIDIEDMYLDDGTILSLEADGIFKYLGIEFTQHGKAPINFKLKLHTYLENLSAAPLKPQQRLYLLRQYALPRLLHPLCLGTGHKKTLQALDQSTRHFLRKWLCLPPDTPVAYFHALIAFGRIGVSHFASLIPHLKWKRLNHMCTSPSPLLRWAATTSCIAASLKLAQAAVSIGKQTTVIREDVRAAWDKELYATVDGAWLKPLRQCPHSNLWLLKNARVFPGLFIRMVQMRCGLMSTKTRRARWRHEQDDVYCRGGCGKPESLKHILQNCSLTHDSRCRRHNDVCKVIHELDVRHGMVTLYEPRIPLPISYCKPDLIAVKDGVAIVMDIQICYPELIHSTWERKISKYDTQQFNTNAINHLSRLGHTVERVEHHPIVVTYNVLLYGRSSLNLHRCGFSTRDLGDVCISTLRGSIRMYDGYMRGTNTH